MCKLESQLTVNATNEYYFSIFNPEVLILIHDTVSLLSRDGSWILSVLVLNTI